MLRNLLGIADAGELAHVEAALSASRLIDLERRRLQGQYHLKPRRVISSPWPVVSLALFGENPVR